MGDLGSIPGLGRFPGEGKDYPLQNSGLENFTDYSPWGHKELDTTEQLSLHFTSLGCLGGGVVTEKALELLVVKVAQSCPTLRPQGI